MAGVNATQETANATLTRILVVGDAQPIAEIWGKFHNDPKWRTDFVCHWQDAAPMLRHARYAVVLVHLGMESASELTVMRTLRATNQHVKIILFVEQSTIDQLLAAIRAHAFSYFSYPFDVSAACHMINTAAALSDWVNGIEVLSATPEYLTLRLRCAMSTADRLVQFMKEVPIELLPDELHDTAQAFRELLLNAIEHGGKLDRNQWVRVSRVRTKRTLVYHIVDPGEGFSRWDLSHAAVSHSDDPLFHVQIREALGYRAGGFGMLIARHMVDEVIYNEQGNQVILIKHVD
jgi:anti-sigma regulatory factor (Ser/Thr protein kinase)/ActR/RegA family two-component response regulator